MYAIGGNENAAQVAGVNVTASLIRIYILPPACMLSVASSSRKGRRRFHQHRQRL